ncbi:MAG: efflux RND transporter periplasmic adaptor subunit [Opitutaceae bacterium]
MKPSSIALISLLVAGAAVGGWWIGRSTARPEHAHVDTHAATTRKTLYHQCPMHPWIKAGEPGKCTICGMDLVPASEDEGDAADAASTTRTGAHAGAVTVTLSEASARIVGVSTTPIREAPLVRSMRVAGVIEDDATRHRVLSAWAAGRIEKLFVNYIGAEVVAGQPLASIYSPLLFTAQKEYIDLQARGAPSALAAAARERLRLLGLREEQLDALKPGSPPSAQTEILAPMSGTVVSRAAYEGLYVDEGDPLFEIADFSRMWFVFDAYESDLAWLETGLPVEVSVESQPVRTFTAPIDFIDPTIDPATRTAQVRVILENPLETDAQGRETRPLKHKLYAEGRVKLASPEVLVAPRSAILNTGARKVAHVDLGGGAFEQRSVRTGRSGDELVEILDGLRAGERVVTEGNLILDGQAQLEAAVEPSPDADPAAGTAGSLPSRAGLQGSDETAAPPDSLQELQQLVDLASRAAAALASDDVQAYRELRPALVEAIRVFDRDFEPQRFEQVGELTETLADPADIAEARRAFEPFSTALAGWLRPFRNQNPDTLDFVTYECPMAPVLGTARWIQTTGPMRNPFFGSAMLACGSEIR